MCMSPTPSRSMHNTFGFTCVITAFQEMFHMLVTLLHFLYWRFLYHPLWPWRLNIYDGVRVMSCRGAGGRTSVKATRGI